MLYQLLNKPDISLKKGLQLRLGSSQRAEKLQHKPHIMRVKPSLTWSIFTLACYQVNKNELLRKKKKLATGKIK